MLCRRLFHLYPDQCPFLNSLLIESDSNRKIAGSAMKKLQASRNQQSRIKTETSRDDKNRGESMKGVDKLIKKRVILYNYFIIYLLLVILLQFYLFFYFCTFIFCQTLFLEILLYFEISCLFSQQFLVVILITNGILHEKKTMKLKC